MSRFSAFRIERPAVSFLVDRRAVLTTALLVATSISVALVSLAAGDYDVGLAAVARALVGLGSRQETLIVVSFRLPRVLVGWLVGAGLGVSGALLQGIARNPLASPEIIGVTGGASVAAVALLVLVPAVGSTLLSLAAFTGAALVAAVMYLLAYRGGFSSIRLVLVGVGIGALTRSLTTLLIVISPMYQASKALLWLTGSVYGSTWADVVTLGPWLGLLLPAAFFLCRHVNALQLGSDVDVSLGGRLNRDVVIVTAVSVGLAGSVVAVAGGIGFVGLMAPHMARLLVGPTYERLVPAAALVGGTIVMAADLVGRTMIGTLDLPAGIFTAAIGAPFFLFLLYRGRQAL